MVLGSCGVAMAMSRASDGALARTRGANSTCSLCCEHEFWPWCTPTNMPGMSECISIPYPPEGFCDPDVVNDPCITETYLAKRKSDFCGLLHAEGPGGCQYGQEPCVSAAVGTCHGFETEPHECRCIMAVETHYGTRTTCSGTACDW